MFNWECIRDSLMEIVGLAGVTAIIAFLRSRGVEGLAEKGFRRLLERLIKGFVKKGATRVIPWIGLILLIVDIINMLVNCWE